MRDHSIVALVTACVLGVDVPGAVEEGQSPLRARVDVWSPHAFVDAFLEKYTTFKLGSFEDASEALQFILDSTPALRALFHAAPNELSDTLIELPRFSDTAEDGVSLQPFLADRPLQSLDMCSFFASVLPSLCNSSELLAVSTSFGSARTALDIGWRGATSLQTGALRPG